MHRKIQNKMKMNYFWSIKKNYVFCKKGGGSPKGILSTRACVFVRAFRSQTRNSWRFAESETKRQKNNNYLYQHKYYSSVIHCYVVMLRVPLSKIFFLKLANLVTVNQSKNHKWLSIHFKSLAKQLKIRIYINLQK